MTQYVVSRRPLYLYGGVLELSDQQYRPRMRCLKPLKKKGLYQVTGKVCFKVGEVVGIGGKIDKATSPFLDEKKAMTPKDKASEPKTEQ